MASPTYDDSEWPLVRIRMPAELSPSEFEASLDYIAALFRRGERFAVMMDVREAPPPTASQRSLIAARSNAMYAVYPTRMVGMALVMSSAIQRGILTAITWIAKDKQTTRAFATMDDAERWLRGQLAAKAGKS